MRNRLIQLLADNRKAFEPIQSKIVAQAAEAAIYLYDPIVGDRMTAEWWGGVCPQDFVPALRALDVDRITIYTNCPGGDVFASEAMCQAIREHKAHVTMQIEGYAASAATKIACACDEVVATPASKYMIHQSWTWAWGNADDLQASVELLRKCDESLFDAYVERSAQARDKVIEWCKAETWFTAAEAKDAGFIDRVLESARTEAKASAKHWNLSAYAHAPVADPPATAAPAPAPAAAAPAPEPTYASSEHRERQAQRLRAASLVALQ